MQTNLPQTGTSVCQLPLNDIDSRMCALLVTCMIKMNAKACSYKFVINLYLKCFVCLCGIMVNVRWTQVLMILSDLDFNCAVAIRLQIQTIAEERIEV